MKSALITGCSAGGIGDALVREFQSRGLHVFATARSADKMAELATLDNVTLVEMDVVDEESIAKAVAAVAKQTGGTLDVLINNAGSTHIMTLADCKMADVKRVLDTNVFGVFAVTHAFLPLLIRAQGVVASIGSVNTVFHPPYQAAYNASKTALQGFSDTLRLEVAPLGVRVVLVQTGSVASRLFANVDDSQRCHLPEGSLYAPLKDKIEQRSFLDGVSWTPASTYAKQVASDLLQDKPKRVVWRAAVSTTAWFLQFLHLEWVVVSHICQHQSSLEINI